jgi:hypothetical protein
MIMRYAKKIAMAILLCGLGLALLQAFGGDPLSVLAWAGDKFIYCVDWVASLFEHSKEFKKVVKPGIILVKPHLLGNFWIK